MRPRSIWRSMRLTLSCSTWGCPMRKDWKRYGGPTQPRPASRWWCLTGMDDEVLAAQALQEGAQDYLIKGQIDARGLLRALRYAVERKVMEEALFVEKERAQVTLNCIGDAVACTDSRGKHHLPQPGGGKNDGLVAAGSGRPAHGRSFPDPGRHNSRNHPQSDGDGRRARPNRAPAVELYSGPARRI